MISKQIVSSYHMNRLTCLTSISIHWSRFPRLGEGGLTRTASRTRPRRPSVLSVVSAVNAVTINLHVSTMKFSLIGKTPMTCYSEIPSHIFSIQTGTALTRLNKRSDFTSKLAKNQGKWTKHAELRDGIFLKNQDGAFKHHHYHHLFFYDRFHRVRSSVFVCDNNLTRTHSCTFVHFKTQSERIFYGCG